MTCEACRHWTPSAVDAFGIRRVRAGYGRCRRIPDSEFAHGDLAIVQDCEDYGAHSTGASGFTSSGGSTGAGGYLETRPEFGCVLHEPREADIDLPAKAALPPAPSTRYLRLSGSFPSIASVVDRDVMFNCGDGGGFVRLKLLEVATVSGTIYMCPSGRLEKVAKALEGIEREESPELPEPAAGSGSDIKAGP